MHVCLHICIRICIKTCMHIHIYLTMDASHSVCFNAEDLIFSKTEIYFVLEDKLLPGSNLASSGLRKCYSNYYLPLMVYR